jgi:hypothetical protein
MRCSVNVSLIFLPLRLCGGVLMFLRNPECSFQLLIERQR